ncbi:MAG: hypothetical protein AB3N14_18590 [Flavobacteriaceae bacterium]
MNKLLAICGLVFISNTTTPQIESTSSEIDTKITEVVQCEVLEAPVQLVSAPEVSKVNKALKAERNIPAELNLNDIVFLEFEEPIDLGFDPADYLPENFDPYKVYFDLNKVTYIDDVKEVQFSFNTMDYLPTDFDPYSVPEDINAISYIEEDEDLDLGFDTAAYLPEGFNPYEVYFDLNSVEYIEEEDEVELDFNTADYLPRGFDPYSR